jgi:Domain of Unknown Function (DUF1080)
MATILTTASLGCMTITQEVFRWPISMEPNARTSPMIRSFCRPAILSLFLLGAVALPAPRLSAQDSGGFRPLFNGKDLSGWVTPADKSLFTVENGEIVGRTTDKPLKKNEFLATDKSYGDFVLKAKVKIRNGNSGIQFRSDRKPDGVVSGPQADVADDQWGLLYEERRRGMLDRYPLDKAKKLLNADGWNEFLITAKGSHVTIDLNGTRIIDRDDPKFDKQGIIALQIHRWPDPMEVRFKDIEIKELTP